MNVPIQASLRAFLTAALAVGNAFAAESYATGNRFQRQLELPAIVFWSDVPLRDGFLNLAKERKLAVWIDRRCDPSSSIAFSANLPTLTDCLWKLSEDLDDVDVVWLEDLLYVGPPSAADRLATVHQIHKSQIAKLPARQKSAWTAKRKLRWPKLSNPVALLKRIERELGKPIKNRKRVFHDLWPEQSLPALPLYVRLELLLVGFDLTYVLEEDGSARILDLPTMPRYSRPLSVAGEKRSVVDELVGSLPGVSWKDEKLTASWRGHEAVRRALSHTSSKVDLSQIRLTLRAENQQLGSFVRSLCQQLSIECKFDDGITNELEERVSFSVEKATIDELFDEILSPRGLAFSRNGAAIAIKKKGETK